MNYSESDLDLDKKEEFKAADNAVYAVKGSYLTDIQKIILKGAWLGYTYEEIADKEGYSDNYLKRDVGPRLWKILSDALGEKVSKKNFRTALQRKLEEAKSTPPQTKKITDTRRDWGEAADVAIFYGRTQEMVVLEQWIVSDRCRVVTILGMAGIGKTALSVKLAQQIQNNFEYVIWRSLDQVPIKDILAELIYFLSHNTEIDLPENISLRTLRLLDYLRKHRCLLILDGLDAILRHRDQEQFHREYEGYSQLIRCIGETAHQSCLLLTSREKPRDFYLKEGEQRLKTLQLSGLNLEEGQQIFKDSQLHGTRESYAKIMNIYGGNPLLLKMVAPIVQDVFDRDITEFLNSGKTVFSNIKNLFDQDFECLSQMEQDIMYWLAINREPVSLRELAEDILQEVHPLELAEALESLRQRALIEKTSGLFTQQPAIAEYVTDRFIKQICLELKTQQFVFFKSHALVKASAKEYIRNAQTRYILQPIVNQLFADMGSRKSIAHHLSKIIKNLQERSPLQPGYTSGNILNLLRHMQVDLDGYDFSHLKIWQARLDVDLHQVNLASSDLDKSVFLANFGSLLAIAFSSNGQFLSAVNTSGATYIWHVPQMKLRHLTKGYNSWLRVATLSPDGQTLVCTSDRTVKLGDVHTGQCLKSLHGHRHPVCAVAVSSDSRMLASASYDGIIKLWSADTGESITTWRGGASYITSLAFSPNSEILISGSSTGTIELWSVSSQRCLTLLHQHTSAIQSVAFSPDGQTIASGSSDRTVKLYSLSTGECLKTLEDHTSEVQSVAFSPDGHTIASGSSDRTIKLWSISTGECRATLKGHTGQIRAVTFNPDGQTLASSSNEQTIKIWELSTGECIRTLRAYANWAVSLAFSADGLMASGNNDASVRLWNPQDGEIRVMQGHTSRVQSVAFSPDCQTLASASNDHTLKLWSVTTGECLITLYGHQNQVRSAAFHPDGSTIISGSDDCTVKLWDATTGECLSTMQHPSQVRTVALSSDGQVIISGSKDRTIRLWHVSTQQCYQTLREHTGHIKAVVLSADGQRLASGSDDGIVKVWDVHTGQCLQSFQADTSTIWAIAFSPDGHILATNGDHFSVRLWDVKTGECLKSLQGHKSWVRAIAFSSDGLIASSSQDETIKLWHITTGECQKTLRTARPYEDMNITDIEGLTDAQKAALKALGAVERS
ncbi:(Myosin heavy-chain) kinase [Gloeocapsa sp. PCC 7428]|uniref:WD40 domain-containing protein n=1 Tax=Gloeocapsa sp. PCC 7428 TaxID=1173026 RepID=UPI0002A603FF|nr:NB-ARC domain-containing protein [Gloeocapsa sp. PCC 7428]AFZ29981.1 (Myosin heavy-chain) kinase [Gloeocapsa sp. PCC 7428]